MGITKIQRNIIESPASSKLLVKAGPGTGKTFSLIERIKYLVKEERLEPATEILILSFSVAASQEIKNRLKTAVEEQGYDDELFYVSIRTFDSFASWFMYSLNPEILLEGCDYDQRIAMATETIRKQEEARNRLKSYRHIMVDEVQDLVGYRASLTLAILDAADGGFTLFGDPAQAVYNFLMDEKEKGPTSDEFLENVYTQFDGNVEVFFLTENFRVGENTELKALADKGRDHLLKSTPQVAYTFLRRTFAELSSLGSLQDVILHDELCSSKTAFLCRTNGQILRLARHFNDQGVNFFIRRPVEELDVAAWVGYVFLEWKIQIVKKKDFIGKIKKLPIDIATDPENLWSDLLRVTRARASVRVPQLRNALLEEGLFAEGVTENNKTGVVLSTVHRSKGREFDNVILTIPEETSPDQFLDEGRVMFVGLTRARCSLYKMSEKGGRGIRKNRERWLRSKNADGKQHLTGIEVGYKGDVDEASFVSLEMFDDDIEEIEENQEFLWEGVRAGMPAHLRLYSKSKKVPIYEIWIGDDALAVGLTSDKFGYSLKNIITDLHGGRPSRYPGIIDKLWVRDTVTEVGNLGNTDVPRKYRTTGLWVGLRLQGLGTCQEWRSLS